MATRFEALDDFLDDALELPVGNKIYRIPAPSAEDGLRVERITTLAAQLVAGGTDPDTTALDDEEELDLYRLCLGPVYGELRADGVSWPTFKRIANTAMFWIIADVEAAQDYWRTGQGPSPAAPNRAARRKSASSASGGANTTSGRASTSGTRAASARKRAAKG